MEGLLLIYSIPTQGTARIKYLHKMQYEGGAMEM